MSKQIQIISSLKLTDSEMNQIKSILAVDTNDQVDVKIDPTLIAGLKVSVNGLSVDMSVKHQLLSIAKQ